MKVVKWILGVLMAGGVVTVLQAQESQEAEKAKEQVIQEAIRDAGTVTLEKKANVPVRDILAELAKQGRTNIVVDQKTISDKDVIDVPELKDVPFREALEVIIRIGGLAIEEETADMIRVTKPPTVSIDLSGASVVEVISIISKISGTDIVMSPQFSGSITLNVRNKPWIDVLDTVVNTVGFIAVREKNGIIRITTADALRSQLETRVFRLKYLQPPPIYKAQTTAAPQILGTPKATGDQVAEFTLLKVLKTALSTDTSGNPLKGTDVQFDLNTNSVIATDTKVGLDKIETIIKKLDVEPQEVIIDVKFVTTTNNNILNYGVSFSSPGQTTPGIETNTIPLAPGGAAGLLANNVAGAAALYSAATATRLPFGILGTDQHIPDGRQFFLTSYGVSAILRLLKNDIYSRIDQKPTIAVLDNAEATIFVGEQVPYAQATVTSVAGSTATTTVLQEGTHSPVSVGFQLLVIPRIIENENKVILTVIPKNELLTGVSATHPGFETFTTAGQTLDLPRIGQTTAVTRLMIDDGLTAILGGLYSATVGATETKLPFFGDIPILGNAFKQKVDTSQRTQLYIFITPRIVKGTRLTNQELNSVLRQRLEQERKMLQERKKQQEESAMKNLKEQRSKEMQKEIEELKKK